MNNPYQAQSTFDLSANAARAPLVYVVVLNYMAAKLTIDCVRSVLKIAYPNLGVIVVDNGSKDDSADRLRGAFSDPRVEILINEKNYGYTGGNNRGIERALSEGAEYIFVLNNDTIAQEGCLTPAIEAMEGNPRLAIAGCPILELASGAQPRMRYGLRVSLSTGKVTDVTNWSQPHEVDAACGSAILLRTETIRRIGMFDPNLFIQWEEIDLCYRARAAGYQISVVPGPGVRHWGSHTIGRFRPLALFYYIRNQAWFVRRHGRLKHRVVFTIFKFSYFYPREILSRLIRGQFELLGALLRGIWEGHGRYPGPVGTSRR